MIAILVYQMIIPGISIFRICKFGQGQIVDTVCIFDLLFYCISVPVTRLSDYTNP